jgi:hypothetical protein
MAEDDTDEVDDTESGTSRERPDDAEFDLDAYADETEPDVFLDIPQLKVDEIELEVEDLRARVSLQAEVLDLLKLNVGVDATLGRVKLKITGVEAQALLKVRLDNVAAIVSRVLATIDRNPQILEHVTRGVEQAATEIGRGAGDATSSIGSSAGRALEDVGDAAGDTLAEVGSGAGRVVEDVGQGAGDTVRSAGDVVETAGDTVRDAGRTVTGSEDEADAEQAGDGDDDEPADDQAEETTEREQAKPTKRPRTRRKADESGPDTERPQRSPGRRSAPRRGRERPPGRDTDQ